MAGQSGHSKILRGGEFKSEFDSSQRRSEGDWQYLGPMSIVRKFPTAFSCSCRIFEVTSVGVFLYNPQGTRVKHKK